MLAGRAPPYSWGSGGFQGLQQSTSSYGLRIRVFLVVFTTSLYVFMFKSNGQFPDPEVPSFLPSVLGEQSSCWTRGRVWGPPVGGGCL